MDTGLFDCSLHNQPTSRSTTFCPFQLCQSAARNQFGDRHNLVHLSRPFPGKGPHLCRSFGASALVVCLVEVLIEIGVGQASLKGDPLHRLVRQRHSRSDPVPSLISPAASFLFPDKRNCSVLPCSQLTWGCSCFSLPSPDRTTTALRPSNHRGPPPNFDRARTTTVRPRPLPRQHNQPHLTIET